MNGDLQAAQGDAASPIRDGQLRFVQRTALLMFLLAATAATVVAVLHWLEPQTNLLNRVMPPLLMVSFLILAWRQWRYPQRMTSSLWVGWAVTLVGLTAPVWLYVGMALGGGSKLVETLPPVGAVFLPWVLLMTLLAPPRLALWGTLIAWLLIAAPVLVYLLWHPQELWTPRGLDLTIALGPLALLVPPLFPLLRGVEQRFREMQHEGERLQALAERDVLIGLYNRRAGERFLTTLLAHSREHAALILFDIDHFKSVNDRFGHAAGDAVLIEVGRRCGAALNADDIFARWGGEEFLVVLPTANAETALARAETLRHRVHAQPIAAVGAVSASFGVTCVKPQDTLAEVLQRADDALYQAKAAGRNRVVML